MSQRSLPPTRGMSRPMTMYWHDGGVHSYEGYEDAEFIMKQFDLNSKPAILCKDGKVVKSPNNHEEFLQEVKGFAVLRGQLDLPEGYWCAYHKSGIHVHEYNNIIEAAILYGYWQNLQPAALVQDGAVIRSTQENTEWYQRILGALVGQESGIFNHRDCSKMMV